MKLFAIAGAIGVLLIGLHMRSQPQMQTTKASDFLNYSERSAVNNVVLLGAQVIQVSEGQVTLQSADGVQLNVYGALDSKQGLAGDATLVRNGNSWNLTRFKAYAGAAENGTLLSVHQNGKTVYGRVFVNGAVQQVRVNDSGFFR